MHTQAFPWQPAFQALEDAINAEGVHTYPFLRSFPMDVGFFVHAGRDHVRMNRHDYAEVIFVEAGGAAIHIADRAFPLKPGSLIVIGANIYHRIVNQPDESVRLISLNFHPEVIRGGERISCAEQYLQPFFCQADDFPHLISPDSALPGECLSLMLKIHSELAADSPLGRLTAGTYLKVLLVLLLKHYQVYFDTARGTQSQHRRVEQLSPLFRLVERHYDRPIRIEEAARLCAMSPSHFMGFFKKTTGESFIAYLNGFKISRAQSLLTETDVPIAAISAQLAFCSQSYFGKVFHAAVGMTPFEYRRRFSQKRVMADPGARARSGVSLTGINC